MSRLWRTGMCLRAGAAALALAAAPVPACVAQGDFDPQVITERFRADGAYLGIEMEEVTADNMAQYKLAEERGVIIRKIESRSPAAEANLKEKDVILEYAGQPVFSTMELRRLVQETPAGRKVDVVVSRDGKKERVSAKIAKREGPVLLRGGRYPDDVFEFDDRMFRYALPGGRGFAFRIPPRSEARPVLGVSLEPVTEQMADFLGVPGKHGALVTQVNEGSPAARAGLRAGDVIVRAGDRTIEGPEDVARALERRSGEKVELRIVRDKKETSVTVELARDGRRGGYRL